MGEPSEQEAVEIRREESGDAAAVRAVNEEAFGRPNEADLVEALRRSGKVALSLVAVDEGEVVGHVLFTAVTLGGAERRGGWAGLGPLAVRPEFQNRGIGSALVTAGLEACRRAGCEVVVVLGHPTYYRRFGFRPANQYSLQCEFAVPEDAFMVVELREGALEGQTGVVRYQQPEFGYF